MAARKNRSGSFGQQSELSQDNSKDKLFTKVNHGGIAKEAGEIQEYAPT